MLKKMNKENETTTYYGVLVVLALYPILAEYYVKDLPITVGDIVVVLCVFFTCIFKLRGCLFFKKSIFLAALCLAAYSFLIGAYNGYSQNGVNNSLAIIKVFFIISLSYYFIECRGKEYYKVIKVIGFICTLFLFYQFIMYVVAGKYVFGEMKFLSNAFPAIEGSFNSIYGGRPTSFFYEPAHYCIYIAPILVISLHYKEFFWSVFFIAGLMLSTSTTGFVIAFASILFYILIEIKSYNKLIIMPAVVITMVIAISLSSLDLTKLSLEYMSSSLRVFGAIDVFKYFSLDNLVFGVGYNGLQSWAEMRGLAFYNYSNSLFFSVMSYGVIGTIIIIFAFIKYFAKNQYYIPLILVTVCILMSDQILFNRNFVYLFFCLISTSGLNSNENNTDVLNYSVLDNYVS